MNPPRHGKSKRSPGVEPVTWHRGWQKVGSPTDEPPTKAGGHLAELSRDDQSRSAVAHRVELSAEPTMLMGDGSREQQYLFASREQRDDDNAPVVFIGHNEDRGLAATVDEARRFALEILSLVDEHEI